jgi:hypothetical protein
VPQISQATSSSNLTTSAERKSVRRSLEEISRNSTKHQPGPKSLQDIRHNVDILLDGEALSELYVMSRIRGLEPTDLTFCSVNSRHTISVTDLGRLLRILRLHSSRSLVRSQVWFWTRPMLHTNVCGALDPYGGQSLLISIQTSHPGRLVPRYHNLHLYQLQPCRLRQTARRIFKRLSITRQARES